MMLSVCQKTPANQKLRVVSKLSFSFLISRLHLKGYFMWILKFDLQRVNIYIAELLVNTLRVDMMFPLI